MGVPWTQGELSILDGDVFDSHKKKVDEMIENWTDYPYGDFKLIARSKKSYAFRKIFVECSCGKKGNLSFILEKCK